MTWNVKGHDDPDIAVVVDHARTMRADVLTLQEVQRRQARAIASALGATSLVWSFKHWPVQWPAEGLAVVGLSQPLRVRSHVLSFRSRVWSWRRRIFQVAVIDRHRPPVVLANAHLSPYAQVALRGREVESMLRMLSSAEGPVVVVGDLNDRPEADMFARFREAGFRDAWVERHPGDEESGATNWHGWRPGTSDPPNQRIDYVLVSSGVDVVSVNVPRPGDDGFTRLATLSDHLPLTATLSFTSGGDGISGPG